MAPTIRGETPVYLRTEQEWEPTVGIPAWFVWLETVSIFSLVSEKTTGPNSTAFLSRHLPGMRR